MILLIYLLKMVACTALFYGYYFFFLRNKKMHQYNRFYILAGLTLSMTLPLIKLPLLAFIGSQQPVIDKSLAGIAFGGWEKEMIVTARHGFITTLLTQQNIIISVYIAGFFIAVFPVLKSLAYVKTLSLTHQATALDNIKFYDTAEPGTPFSFFNTIFWNRSISIETEEGQQILRHELYHVKQRHSYDVLFTQLLCSVLWFNPFCYLLTKELKMIHEFLADEYAASETNKHQYAKMLVMQAVTPRQVLISNQFFYNQIKRRITMILQSNNTRYSYIRKVMTVPVAVFIFCACSVKNKDEALLAGQKTAAGSIDKVYVKPEVESTYPGEASGWMRFLNKTFRYPMEAQEQEIQGTVILEFTVGKDGSVSNIKTVEPVPTDRKGSMNGIVVHALSKNKEITDVKATEEQAEILKNEAIRVLTLSGKWVPAKVNGVNVASMKRQPITFKLEYQ